MVIAALLLLASDWTIDPARSKVVVHVYKKGAAKAFLHDHEMVPDHWGGKISFDPAHPETTSVDLTSQADSLHDKETALTENDRKKVDEETRKNVLEVEKYPTIELKADKLTREKTDALEGKLEGTLTLHGQTHPVSVPVSAAVEGSELHAHGKAPLKQTDFGIKPISKALGTIQVKDGVDVEFELVATPA